MTKSFVLGDHWAFFGDGNCAQIIDSKEYIKPTTGLKCIKFILIPSELTKMTYDLNEKLDRNTGACIMEYHWTEVIWLQKGVSRSRCWVMTDFMGGPTPASRRTEDLKETIRDSERLLKSAEAAKNRAYQELEKERTQQLESIKAKVNMVKEVAKARGRIDEEQAMMDGTMDMSNPPSG